MSSFACMYFQDPSLLQFQKRLQDEQQRNNLHTMFGVESIPEDTQLRNVIDTVKSDEFRPIFREFYARLQRGKHLEQYQLLKNKYLLALDGSQFFSSKEINCEHCLTKKHRNGEVSYSHQVLQPAIMHPNCSEVIPFMPEEICNNDGNTKQDCEMNAAKRLIKKIKNELPKLKLILNGDSLFSRQPLIEEASRAGMNYIFVAKPGDHKYLMEEVEAYDKLHGLHSKEVIDNKRRRLVYEWINDVTLNGREDSINVNFFRFSIIITNKIGEEKIAYKSSWVTDLQVSKDNVELLVSGGRCRWKAENEIFNVMKNHGYYMDRNFGHGKQNLAFNFYLLTLIAFFMHQIFELTDKLYEQNRKKFANKRHMWESLRSYIQIIVFDSWEHLLEFALKPIAYRLYADSS